MPGGVVECGPQRITYTGVAGDSGLGSLTPQRAIGAPTTNLSNLYTFGVAFPAGYSCYYCYTFIDATGESTRSPLAGLLTNTSGGQADANLSSIDTGPAGVTGRRIYRTRDLGVPSGPFYRVGTIANNTATTFSDNVPDGSLGSENPPTTDTTGLAAVAAGATSLPVSDLSVFLSGGGWVRVGDQVIRYTGRSAASGAGTLTGIPASGNGAIGAPVAVGTAVVNQPHLTGVTGIQYPINKGEPVNIVVTVDDVPAQTALAALVGGDGIHEMFISDGRWSRTEATARATAELAQRKDPLVTVHLTSRDPGMASGRDVTITKTFPAISGTFKIQRVIITIDVPTQKVFPIRQVECSARRYSLEDLLRRIKGAA